MKTEKEPHVIFFIIQQMPASLIANDPDVSAFVQEMTGHENERIRKVAEMRLEDAAKLNQ